MTLPLRMMMMIHGTNLRLAIQHGHGGLTMAMHGSMVIHGSMVMMVIHGSSSMMGIHGNILEAGSITMINIVQLFALSVSGMVRIIRLFTLRLQPLSGSAQTFK